MERNNQILTAIEGRIRHSIPEYRRIIKESSQLMWLIAKLISFFNPRFMQHYITTIYPKVYVPSKINQRSGALWPVLCHEWWHLWQAKQQTPLMHSFFYLFPQSLSPLALLALVAIWSSNNWLWCLLWLLCLLPLPAYFRMREELRAYTISMAAHHWNGTPMTPADIEHYAHHFYGRAYYYMWPFKNNIIKRLRKEYSRILLGDFCETFPFNRIKEVLTWY